MANNQEFNSIDELFRKSFSDLPASPANNGWDTPSDRVWQNIHSNMQPTSGGWSLNAKLLVGASITALILAVAYWVFKPSAPHTVPPAPVEQPVVAPPTQSAPAASVSNETPAAKPADHTATTKVKPADKPTKTPAAKAPATTTDTNNGGPKNTAEKGKPAPNSIEKRKLEQVKQEQY